MSKRNERMETLKENGIETGKYFTLNLPEGLKPGSSIQVRINEQGNPVVAYETTDGDSILRGIIEDGYVRNSKLHRRWVMAQMFHMLNYKSYDGKETGYDACLRNRYDYQYQFSMMLEEIWVLSKLEDKDVETFNERTHFFNREVVVATCEDYMRKLREYIENLPTKKCKGVPYKRLNGRYGDVFVADLRKKVYGPMELFIRLMGMSHNYRQLHYDLLRFTKLMIRLPYNTPKCKEWIDAFKGAGAYYTLLNLTRFHQCKIVDEQQSMYWHKAFTYAAGIEASDFVKSKLDAYKGEGWRYMAMLKKCIADNEFEFSKRMKEVYRNK